MKRPLRIWFAAAFAAIAVAVPGIAAGLPEGTGKQVLVKNCSGCHNPDSFTTYAKTKEDWEAVVQRMGTRTPASREELDILADYLAANLPKVDDPNKVNMNKADAKQIESLGFTPQEAEAIVVYRERRGQYRTWGDMLVIYGVDGRKVQAASEKMAF